MTNQAKEKYSVEFKENAVKCANESSNVADASESKKATHDKELTVVITTAKTA